MEIEPSIVVKIVLLGVLVVLSAFFASCESAFFSLGHHRVRRILHYGKKRYQATRQLLEQPTGLISTLLIGNEFVNAAISVVGSSLVYELLADRFPGPWLPFLAIAWVLPFLLVFGEIVPKTLGLRYAERVTALNSLPLKFFFVLVGPVRKLILWGPDALLKVLGARKSVDAGVSEQVFRSMVDASTAEGLLETQEQKLIHNVLKLDDLKVTKIMTPAQKISFFYANDKLETVWPKLKADSYSRYPVLDKHKGTVVGVVYAKDLLLLDEEQLGREIRHCMRKALVITETSNALELFAQFKLRRMHFGIVVPSLGQGFLGVITLEDVLEEVFGELKDERDLEEGLC